MMQRTRTIGTVGYMGGIPALLEPFVWSWTQMIQFTPEALCREGERVDFVHALQSFHSAGRDELVSKMKGDWLLQLDTDMVFDPDFVARLVMIFERYKLDILTGLYTYKSNPAMPVLYKFNEQTKRHEGLIDWTRELDLIEVDSAGAGCLLVRRNVYDRIYSELREGAFQIIPPYGEDHSFFMRARKLGFKTYCAWKVQASHLGFKEVQHQFNPDLPVLNEYEVTGYGTRQGEKAA